MIFTFFIRLSESRFGRPFFLKIIFPSLSFFIFIFQFVDGCSNESVLWINFYCTVHLLLWFREAVRNFQPLFWLFRGYFCCSTFWLACFFFLFIINNFPWDTSDEPPNTLEVFSRSPPVWTNWNSFDDQMKTFEMKLTQKHLKWNLHFCDW